MLALFLMHLGTYIVLKLSRLAYNYWPEPIYGYLAQQHFAGPSPLAGSKNLQGSYNYSKFGIT